MVERKAQLTVVQRLLVIDLKNQGKSFKEIAQETGIPSSTAKSIVQKHKTFRTVEDLPGRGRKRKTTARIDRKIIGQVKANRRLSAVQVAEGLQRTDNIFISSKTVRRRLHEAHFQSRIAQKKPFLSVKHKKARLQFAQEHKESRLSSGGRSCGPMNPSSISFYQTDRPKCGAGLEKPSSSVASEARSNLAAAT
jgi:transposase